MSTLFRTGQSSLWVHWFIERVSCIHCAPLEREDWTYPHSIDISLRWSERQSDRWAGRPRPYRKSDGFSISSSLDYYNEGYGIRSIPTIIITQVASSRYIALNPNLRLPMP